MKRVLVVDDEKNITLVVSAILEKQGYEVVTANDPRLAIAQFRRDRFHTILTDLYMTPVDGMGVMEAARKVNPGVPVIVMTAHGTVEAAVSALKKGAFDFITKPFDQDELVSTVEKAVRTQEKSAGSSIMIGVSPPMAEVFKMIKKIAPSGSTVLIQGESGTGKELVAQEIHRQSQRREAPFVRVNCGAIPANLIESELFGYEKGAFTGAVTSKPGRFELADRGTLFLDEVGDMPIEMQIKLLRALQEQEFERVGGVSPIRVDVRIIAATNKNLESEVASGRFREDLFYRLNVLPITLPPLRDRPEDIELLIISFLDRLGRREGEKASTLKMSPDCLAVLKGYEWPGNVRQLENTIERMLVLCEGTELSVSDLPTDFKGDLRDKASESSCFKDIVRMKTQSVERELIGRALEETGGNITRAAEKLGLSRKGLQLKLKELGLDRKDFGILPTDIGL